MKAEFRASFTPFAPLESGFLSPVKGVRGISYFTAGLTAYYAQPAGGKNRLHRLHPSPGATP